MELPTDILAVVYPEVVLLSRPFPNSFEGIKEFDDEVTGLAQGYGLKPVYGLEDVGIYGKVLKDLSLEGGGGQLG